ncbi:MAG: bifunctional diaminohydroxyphosphoribosylaminopyrimidine deaminase/5-amino-6-(5-phosphoribosylamino)uracil reductase RibD [Bacteroidales bacterium]
MANANDRKYMERALELASMATGNTSPNPLVGAVIIAGDRIIGEGYHTAAGRPHAEIMAINSVKDKSLLKESSMYVSLEPCSHHGRTPPCAERIKQEGIPEVIIACKDPNPDVSGRGTDILRQAGVKVRMAVLEDEARVINRRFITYHEKGRPYIILKWAQSFDGYLDRLRAGSTLRGPNWITGVEEQILVHKWRTEEDAILIGDRTACNDDPGLDARLWAGSSPRRFVLSEMPELPGDLKIFKGEPRTVIFSRGSTKKEAGAEYHKINSRDKTLEEVLDYMYKSEILSVIIEGGYSVLSQFIEAGLWDEARIFKGEMVFRAGLKAPLLEGVVTGRQDFPSSRLEYWRPYD